MYAVIFEVQPKSGAIDDYLNIAASLKIELEKIDGFISVERFQSMVNKDKLVSLSFWRDEQAILDWRSQTKHQEAQSEGYKQIFETYRIRVAEVVRDYSMTDRNQAPQAPPV